MIWLAFRQFRAALAGTAVLVLVLVTVLAVHGFSAHQLLAQAETQGCVSTGLAPCDELIHQLTRRLRQLAPYLGYLAFSAPLIGAFWGAPLVARELEGGTAALAWSQSVTRRRWLTTQLTVGSTAVAVLGLVMGFSITAWMSVFADLYPGYSVYSFFTLHGILLAVEWSSAFLIGAAAGALARRTLPAIAATVLTVFAIGVALSITSSGYTPTPNTTAAVFVGQLIESGLLLVAGGAAVVVAYQRVGKATA